MPGQMPEMLSRGPNLLNLDALLVANKTTLEAVLALLTNQVSSNEEPTNTAKQDEVIAHFLALVTGQGVFTGSDIDHFHKDWLRRGAEKMWWPEADPIAPVLRRGYITAIRIALGEAPGVREGGNVLRIQSLWVCTPPADYDVGTTTSGRVHVGVTWSEAGVIVVIHTPRLPDEGFSPPKPTDTTDPVVVIRWEGAPKSHIVEVRPKSPAPTP